MQRIQYAKAKSDIIAKADGTFVPREKRKRHEDKGTTLLVFFLMDIKLYVWTHIWTKTK